MVAHFYAVHAQKLDTTPEALYQQYPLKVDSLLSEGQVFGQNRDIPYLNDSKHIDAMRHYFEKNGVKVNQDNTVTLWHAISEESKRLALPPILNFHPVI